MGNLADVRAALDTYVLTTVPLITLVPPAGANRTGYNKG